MDLVALVEQQLGQIGAVLAGDAGDERAPGHAVSLPQAVDRTEPRPVAGVVGVRLGMTAEDVLFSRQRSLDMLNRFLRCA